MCRQLQCENLGARAVLSACVLAACCGLAVAKPDGGPRPERPAQKQGEPLGGPKVRDDAKPGDNGKFAPREGRRDEMPHPMVVRFLKRMASNETPEEMRLSAEQATRLEEIEKEFQDSTKAYREKNRDEVMKLREVLPPEERRRVDAMLGQPDGQGRPGQRTGEGRPEGKPEGKPGERRGSPRDGDAMAPGSKGEKPANREEVEKARGRLREIADAAPKPGQAHEKMFGVLNDAQREYAKKEIEKARDDMRKRSEERAKGRPGGERGGEADRMPPEMREKIERLSPEEREKFRSMSPEEKRAFMHKLMDGESK